MFENLYATADEIRLLLMPFAFVLCVIGIGEMGWRAGSDARGILGTLLKVIFIVTLITSYPQIMKGGQTAFMEMRSKFTNAQDAKFVSLLRSRIENQPSDSLANIGKIVPAAIGYFFQGIGRFMLLVLRFFQEFSIAGLIAISPLLIGFLFFSYTQSLGINFGVTSLTVLLWHVAICLVDITIQLISDILYMPITTGTVVQTAQNLIVVTNWLMFPFVMAFASFITVFFYLSVPFVASAIMRGVSGTTAAFQGGMQGGLQAGGMLLGTGLTVAGAAATMGASSAAQAALAGAEVGSDAIQTAGRIGHDIHGAIGGSSGAASSQQHGDGSSGDLPPPPSTSAGSSGSSVANPSNPAMVAHQTAPNAFAVVDHDRGTVSHHRGNIATPQVAQSAFNIHSSKAQSLPMDSPLAKSAPPPISRA
jgi:hypothetical protein